MTDLQRLLSPPTDSYPATSRYHATPAITTVLADGRIVAHLKRRFVPAPERFATLSEHTVTQGERLDLISARYLGDPTQFWRVADANGVIRPEQLTATLGARIRITLPEGFGGSDGG